MRSVFEANVHSIRGRMKQSCKPLHFYFRPL
nr:MAG TPA: hypothetical protein [Caudoviricetes sp.]